MYQEIGDHIEVFVRFSRGTLLPQSFLWNGRSYHVEKITLTHQARQGESLLSLFSLMASGNMYQLSFDNQSFIWTLVKIWQQ